MKASITSKIIITFAALTVLVMGAQVVFNEFFARDFYTNYKYDSMSEAYEAVVQGYDGTQESIEAAAEAYESEHNINYIVISEERLLYTSFNRALAEVFDGGGQVVPNIESVVEDMPNMDMHSPRIRGEYTYDDKLLELSSSFMHDDTEVNVFLTLPMDSIEDSVDVLTQSGTVISFFSLLIGFVLCVLISKSITKPIMEIELAARKMSELDFSVRVRENISSTELSRLSGSVNSMSEQLEAAITELSDKNQKLKTDIEAAKTMEAMRREFVGNVSHEMKTPLALLQIYAENLRNNVENIDREYYCDTIIDETEKLSELVSTMLDISALESGMTRMEMTDLDISNLLVQLMDTLRPLTSEREFVMSAERGIEVRGNAKYLEQAMRNYILNALEHTEQGDKIEISLKSTEGLVEYLVFNKGEHIEENEIEKIWNSFYRSDKARVRNGNNVGLGLHIVKTVVDRHGGSYACRNRDGGVEFSFRLPII